MTQSRWGSKSYSFRAKLGWLALLLFVILTVYCYSSPRLQNLSSQQSEIRDIRLSLNQGLGTTVLKNSHITEHSELPRADDSNNSDKFAQNPDEVSNSWTTLLLPSQDHTRSRVSSEAIFSDVTESVLTEQAADSKEPVPDMDTAVVGEATWSDFTEKAQVVESIADTAVQFQELTERTSDPATDKGSLPILDFKESEPLELEENKWEPQGFENSNDGEPQGFENSNDGEPLGFENSNDGEPLGFENSNDGEPLGFENSNDGEPLGFENSYEGEPLGFENSNKREPQGFEDSNDGEPLGFENSNEREPLGFENSNEREPLGFEDNNDGEPQGFENFEERETPAFEDNNEFRYLSEEDEVINVTESNYYDLEMEDGRNSSDTGVKLVNTNYNITTSEFGIVFSDLEPNEEDEAMGDDETGNQQEVWLESNEPYDGWSNRISTPTLPTPTEHSQNSPAAPSKSIELLFSSLKHIVNSSDPRCAISTRFSSWEKGVVTQLGIPIKRDCHKLRMNTAAEVKRVNLKYQVTKWRSAKPWEQFAMKFKQKSCDQIRAEFENNFYVSELEKEFPIAYIFVVYTNAGQVLRLLKSIYRPHNLYCIHPDARQGQGFASFFKTVAKCLDNVFIVSKPVRVYYGHISITDAQLHCMQDLMTYPQTRWKYVINLCGREVLLKTNREIVESLVKMKGYTALNLKNLTPNFWNSRFRFKFRLGRRGRIQRTRQHQSRPPQGIRIYKSMNFFAASREFVSFLLHNPLSQKLRRYLGTVYAPEEHFYSSLYALPQAKGARPPRGALQSNTMPVVDMFIWINTQWQAKNMRYYCPGRRIVHGICILTGPDLGRIEKLGVSSKQPVFFFNKYFLEWDPTAMDCMEERLVKTNMDEYKRDCVPPHKH